MKIIITRTNIKELTTDGHLSIDGVKICETAEATPTLLSPGVYDVNILKCGRAARKMPIVAHRPSELQCQLCKAAVLRRKRAKFDCYCQLEEAIREESTEEELHKLELQLTDDIRQNYSYMSRCPQIKVGNGVYNCTDGSILVGHRIRPGIVIRSREVFDRLYERIEKSASRGHRIRLVIR